MSQESTALFRAQSRSGLAAVSRWLELACQKQQVQRRNSPSKVKPRCPINYGASRVDREMTKSTNRCLRVYLLIVALSCCSHAQRSQNANYDESRVGTYTLPDPLVLNDGKPVRNASDWQKRRHELLELFATNVYGHSPKPQQSNRYKVFDLDKNALSGKAVRKQITIYFSPKDDGPKEDVLLYIPVNAQKPIPVI